MHTSCYDTHQAFTCSPRNSVALTLPLQIYHSKNMDEQEVHACLDRLHQAGRVGLGFIWDSSLTPQLGTAQPHSLHTSGKPEAGAQAGQPQQQEKQDQRQQQQQEQQQQAGHGSPAVTSTRHAALLSSLVGVVVAVDHKEAIWLHLRGKHR